MEPEVHPQHGPLGLCVDGMLGRLRHLRPKFQYSDYRPVPEYGNPYDNHVGAIPRSMLIMLTLRLVCKSVLIMTCFLFQDNNRLYIYTHIYIYIPEHPLVVPFGNSAPQNLTKSITSPKKELQMEVQDDEGIYYRYIYIYTWGLFDLINIGNNH